MTTPGHDPFEKALSRRLSQLSAMPVDTAGLEQRVRAEVGEPEGVRARWQLNLRPLAAVAASLILMLTLAAVMLQAGPVQASSADMFQLHRDIVAGKIDTMPVSSIEDANKFFAALPDDLPTIAAPPEAHAMSCCMRDVANKRVACVLFHSGESKVTLSMADTSAVKPLKSVVARNGRTYEVENLGELHMVMTDSGGHRLCLISEQSAEELITLCERIKF